MSEDNIGKRKAGLKINNQKSIFNKIPKKPNPDEFAKKIQTSQDKSIQDQYEISQLSLMFKNLLEDKTLSSNKSMIAFDAEKDLIQKLAEAALKINEDEMQPEGMGSIGLVIVLLRSLLLQRDKINQLEHDIKELNKIKPLKVNE